jgi:GDPmannose 4,6-dehydratase
MGVTLEWRGQGVEEEGVVTASTWGHIVPGIVLVRVDSRYFRPTEVEALQADIAKARQKLGWEPRMTFEELVKIMMDCDARSLGLEPACEGLAASRCKGFDYTNHDVSVYERIREH